MKFKTSLVKAATFPGPLYYLKSRKPGPDIPMEVQLSLPHQGHTLITNKYDNYFRLRLSVLHVVDAVTCLSRKSFSHDVLGKLYGKHEAVFNKLLLRFQLGQIEDLFSFFIQPWLSAIYQDTFAELMESIEEHEIGKVLERIKTTYPMFDQESRLKLGEDRRVTLQSPGGEGSLSRKSMKLTPSENLAERTRGPSDIPTECGQCVELRDEVRTLWEAIKGERVVRHHMGKHIEKYETPNPQYALPKAEFYKERDDEK